MAEWRDITSFSQRDTQRIPATFELRVEPIRIVVMRTRDEPGRWWIRCAAMGLERRLEAVELRAAKHEALLLVSASLRNILDQITCN